MKYKITDDATLNDAIRYCEEIYDPAVISAYIDDDTDTIMTDKEQPTQLS